ncbi:MAG: hypothetical protein PHS97_01045 [Oscillospiraceae bacterium]|nr:hypothetical protein [Oscillospiraceae bacterium]
MSETARRKTDQSLSAPNAEGNVWPRQVCPAFTPRVGIIAPIPECWYCQYADFHLDRPRALEVGVCEWPKKVLG